MKVGIVGAGFMGTTHAAGWAETEAEIVGIVAETADEAMPLAKQYNAKVYPDLASMLPDVDVVDICYSHTSASRNDIASRCRRETYHLRKTVGDAPPLRRGK